MRGIVRYRGRSGVGPKPDASPLPFSIVSFVQVCFRQHLHCIPFRAQTSRHRHLFAGLFGCNRSRALLFICRLLIYIYSCLFVSMSIRVSCVDGPCPCVSLLVRNRASLSLFPLLSPALWFKTPVVPPRFSAHARCNATYLVNPK